LVAGLEVLCRRDEDDNRQPAPSGIACSVGHALANGLDRTEAVALLEEGLEAAVIGGFDQWLNLDRIHRDRLVLVMRNSELHTSEGKMPKAGCSAESA
jgi:hypothetical protein